MAQVVVGEAGFFGAEEDGGAAGLGLLFRRSTIDLWGARALVPRLQSLQNTWGGLLEGLYGAIEIAFADGGGADDETAVGDGFRKGGEAASLLHDRGCANSGLRDLRVFKLGGFEGGGIVVDDAEVGEAEVLHGAGGGADVAGVTGSDEDYGEAGTCSGGEHGSILGEALGGG